MILFFARGDSARHSKKKFVRRARKSWFKTIAPFPASLGALIRERIIGYRVATNDQRP